MQDTHIRVGAAALIIKGNQILLGRRKGSLGAGLWASAGGHVEYGETLEQAVRRELAEECGIQIKNLRFLCVSDFLTHYPERHYVDVGFVAEWESGEPQVLEPDKRENWLWADIDQLPPDNELFPGMKNYLDAYKTGKAYFTLLPKV